MYISHLEYESNEQLPVTWIAHEVVSVIIVGLLIVGKSPGLYIMKLYH